MPALEKVLGDADRDVRRVACHALGEIGPEAKPTTPKLSELLQDQELSVRLAAAFALQNIDPAGRAYVPVLVQAMRQREGGVIVAVGKMGAEAAWAVPTLAWLLRDPRPGTRRLAAEALGKIGPACASVGSGAPPGLARRRPTGPRSGREGAASRQPSRRILTEP